ncbi:AAA family ATPase [bacterium]|nr:MAG: AAA family ATPase [bacterium]
MIELIDKALKALEDEIETVRKKPSKEVLRSGKLLRKVSDTEFIVEFDHPIQSLKFVDECKAHIKEKSHIVSPIDITEHATILKFTEMPDSGFDSIELEWENDFVLKKTKEKLAQLSDSQKWGILPYLLEPTQDTNVTSNQYEVYEDGSRNQAQFASIEKALNTNISFIWGPPGTGKTSTLGFVVANFLLHEKKVLFASNTNRAVDVGVKSIIDAFDALDVELKRNTLTRFGDLALIEDELEAVSFNKWMEGKREDNQQKAVQFQNLLNQLQNLESQTQTMLSEGKAIPDAVETQLIFIQEAVSQRGGREYLEQKISTSTHVNEHNELAKFQCISTTLAKVCTSDLLDDMDFDVVVVDEASMANLPYLFVLAAKSNKHMVLVGDPMQLPPISVSENLESRTFLEKDIFTFLSGADSVNALFDWHDTYPDFTSFFDTQYRLNHDLAEIISSTFYDGRLKTEKETIFSEHSLMDSFQVLDSSYLKPGIVKKDGDGFRPLNETHINLVAELVTQQLLINYQPEEIGIIVPFRSVVWEYRKQLRQLGCADIEVGTVHTFQGREKSIIIFDTVMSGENGRHYTVRPFDEHKSGIQVPRLLNVAFSRSKDKFYIVVDIHHLNRAYRSKFLGKLVSKMLQTQSSR